MKVRSDFVTNSSAANYILQLQIPNHRFSEREVLEEIVEAMHSVSWIFSTKKLRLKDTMTGKNNYSYEIEKKLIEKEVERFISKVEIDGPRVDIHGYTSMYNDDFESIDPVVNQIIHAVLTQQLFPTAKIVRLVVDNN